MTIKTQDDPALIIKLIRDCLISWKLIHGLNALGLNADDYHLYLGDTIFELMGFRGSRESDLIYENVFLANCEKVRSIRFAASLDELDKLSEKIYEELVFAREMVR